MLRRAEAAHTVVSIMAPRAHPPVATKRTPPARAHPARPARRATARARPAVTPPPSARVGNAKANASILSAVCDFLKLLGFSATQAGVRRFLQGVGGGGGGGGGGAVEGLVEFAFFPDGRSLTAAACRPCARVCAATTVAVVSPRLTAALRNQAVALAKKITREVDDYMRRTHGQPLTVYVYRLAKAKGGTLARLGLSVSGPAFNAAELTGPTRRRVRAFILRLVVAQLEAHLPTVLKIGRAHV